jgi:hypothetical protein
MIQHADLGNYQCYFDGDPDLLFCDNETNLQHLYNQTVLLLRHSPVAERRPGNCSSADKASQWTQQRLATPLNNADIISMPDTWEYPWYAAWDLAFHCVTLAMIDPAFAKNQLLLMTREWYMHPNGQIPAYEWKLGDVNPPGHAWAA